MLLRRLTKHLKEQNWFAVALEFAIVVLGVGVAMMGQQWLSDRQQRADMRVAEAALQIDLFSNYANAKERLALAACRRDAYQAIAAQLLKPDETWTGMPRADKPQAVGQVLPSLLRSPHRNWGSRNWAAGLARGTFNQMDEARRDSLDAIFKQSVAAEEFHSEIFTLEGRMKTLAVTTKISPHDRLRYYDMLGELDAKSYMLEVVSGQIIEEIENIGINLSAEYRAEILKALPSSNDLAVSVYGTCRAPVEWPILENRVRKAEAL